jgi:hypothetical protein
MALAGRLERAVTASLARVEARPLTRGRLAARLRRSAYVRHRAERQTVHDPLEDEIAHHATDVAVDRPRLARVAPLSLNHRASGAASVLPDAPPETRDLVPRIGKFTQTAPGAMLGVL